MKTRGLKMEDGELQARSVVGRCGPPPLSQASQPTCDKQSARGLAQFKTWRMPLAFLLLHSIFCHWAWAQYSIDWSKIAGGGGMIAGGVYSVSGTIGQPDAGLAMSGGNFSVSGGYWSLIAVVQTAGSPTLTLSHSGASVMISWPSSSTGFSLEHNSNLSLPNNWSAVSQGISLNNGIFSVTVPLTAGSDFFRLRNP